MLEFDVDNDAVPGVYPIGIEIRCTGDRDLGDDNVYIFNKQIREEVSASSYLSRHTVPGFELLASLVAFIFSFVVVKRRRKGV